MDIKGFFVMRCVDWLTELCDVLHFAIVVVIYIACNTIRRSKGSGKVIKRYEKGSD